MKNILDNGIYYLPDAWAYLLDRPTIKNQIEETYAYAMCYFDEYYFSVQKFWLDGNYFNDDPWVWIWIHSDEYKKTCQHHELNMPNSVHAFDEGMESWLPDSAFGEWGSEERYFDLEPSLFKEWTTG